jgi:TonB family protein
MLRLLTIATLALAPGAQSGEAPAPRGALPQSRPDITLEDIERGLANFKAMIWAQPGLEGHPPPDHTGRRLEDDLARHVLSEQTLVRIEEQTRRLAAISPTGSAVIAPQALEPLNKLMNTESCRFARVLAYWQGRRSTAFHEDMVQRLIERLPPANRSARLTQLESLGARSDGLRASLDTEVAGCTETSDPIQYLPDSGKTLLKDYNSLRLQIVGDLAKLAGVDPELILIKRSTPCPPQASFDGTGKLRLISGKSPSDLYPREAIRHSVEGRVRVLVDYDATGCVVATAIRESAGSELLDQAGLEYGFSLVLQPAEENGKRVGSRIFAPVTFQMMEVPGRPSDPATQAQP